MKTLIKKLYLLPVVIHRLTGRLPFQVKPGGVQFANINEGTVDLGVKSFIPDAASSYRYLLYKTGTDVDHCDVATATTDRILGPSDDQAYAGVGLAINLLGVKPGTVRMVTDGTISDGDYVKPTTAGQVTKASNGDAIVGRAIIPSEATKAAGDAIEVQHCLQGKLPF